MLFISIMIDNFLGMYRCFSVIWLVNFVSVAAVLEVAL